MKKNALILIWLTIILLSSCTNNKKTETSVYSAEKPYVVENAVISNEQSRYPLNTGINSNLITLLNEIDNIDINTVFPETCGDLGCSHDGMILNVTKVHSNSYYWFDQDNEQEIAFTYTELKVNSKISGSGTRYAEAKTGDIIGVIEYFGYSPDGRFGCNYEFIPESAVKEKLFSVILNISPEPLHPKPMASYSLVDSPAVMSPLMKMNHDYIIFLYEDYFLTDSNNLIVNGSVVPKDYSVNSYARFHVFELSEEAYETAFINIITSSEGNGYRFHDECLLELHEQYTDYSIDPIIQKYKNKHLCVNFLYAASGIAVGALVTFLIMKKRRKN